MTIADEERFIQVWERGLDTAQIARQLGLTVTTAQSRAHRLQQRGLIQPRPKGGNYPTERVKIRVPGEGGPSTIHPDTVDGPPSHRAAISLSTLAPVSCDS